VPWGVERQEARVPPTTSEAVARATVEALGLAGVEASSELVALGRERPMPAGHSQGHHGHGHG
jgi:hypothetical protein